jgi:P-type Cu+ transporter
LLAAPVIVPPAQFPYWQWVSLVLATPVVVWGAFPLHAAVVAVTVAADADERQLRFVAGPAEDAPDHPVARTTANYARRPSPLVAPSDFQNHPGLDIEATIGGRVGLVGRAARGVIVIADTPKPTSREAIDRLRALGLRPLLLSGDTEQTTRATARDLAITEAIGDVLPAEKVAVITRLQQQGWVVAMVGDGVNDAAALTQVDLGLAIGTATDAAIEAADIMIVNGAR